MAKNQFIRARVAGWEKDCIRRKADAAHMTESEFVRRAAMDREVTVIEGILDAMNTGDNDRFHLETLHHSKQEIRRILERGGKIDRTVEYAVDDEDEEYEQYHGFSMRM